MKNSDNQTPITAKQNQTRIPKDLIDLQPSL